MQRFLHYFNLLGVVLLALLCCLQWNINRTLTLEQLGLRKETTEQSAKIADQEQAIKGYTSDLDSFRNRLETAENQERQTAAKLATAETERDALRSDATTLKESLTKWQVAVAARDESIKQQGLQIQNLADARNDAVNKFNTLATKYNEVVANLNKAADEIQGLVRQRDEAVAKFNALADQYNALVKASSTK